MELLVVIAIMLLVLSMVIVTAVKVYRIVKFFKK